MRFPKLYDPGTLRRTGIAVLISLALVGLFYWYQPNRYDLFDRTPEKPLPKIPIERTGLFAQGKRIALVTAHPDDEAFYLGGTLFKLKETGADVSLLVLTDGDKAYYPFFDSAPLRKVRRQETADVAQRVGIKRVTFFGYPDGRLSYDDGPIDRLAVELNSLEPDIVLAFDPYYWKRVSHRDHRVAGEIAQEAMKRAGFTGWVLYFSTVAPNTFSDVDETWPQAQELLGAHRSQFFGEKLVRIQNMVSANALSGGQKFDACFAETFRVVRYMSGRRSD